MRRLPRTTLIHLCLALGLLTACQAAQQQPADAKIDSQVTAAAQALAHGMPVDAHTDAQGRLMVYVYVTDTHMDTLQRLAQAGLVDAQPSPEMSVVQGWANPSALHNLAALACVKVITLPRFASPR